MAINKGSKDIEMTITSIDIRDADKKIVLTFEDGYLDESGEFVSVTKHGYITLTGADFEALSTDIPDGTLQCREYIKQSLYALLSTRGFMDPANGEILYRSTNQLDAALAGESDGVI